MVTYPERTMAAGEFKAHCLRVMDEVQRGREAVVITKKGKPVARLVPIEADADRSVFGCLSADFEIVGDILSPLVAPGDWEATRP
jgi:prevent-host-death family protein